MKNPAFIITIDTEGDNVWKRHKDVTTANARFLPRFQSVCEDFGFKPTYLVNYEMAIDPYFQEFGRAVLITDKAEIGLHVHPWYSPPDGVIFDNGSEHIYLYELSDEMLYAKIDYLTKLLIDLFDVQPISHRAGRWGFDERVARALVEMGYLVDCSVTPGVSWRKHKGAADGKGGPDYFYFPQLPYFLDLNCVKNSGGSPMLEVPVTVKPNYHLALQKFHHAIEDHLIAKAFRRIIGPPYNWLRPDGRNIEAMVSLVDWAVQQQFPVLEFMLHSSELMPGGSPIFKTAEQIECLYQDLRKLFAYLTRFGAVGMTLAEYRRKGL
jgi:hypothetical protein